MKGIHFPFLGKLYFLNCRLHSIVTKFSNFNRVCYSSKCFHDSMSVVGKVGHIWTITEALLGGTSASILV